jgi:hypothetical protein
VYIFLQDNLPSFPFPFQISTSGLLIRNPSFLCIQPFKRQSETFFLITHDRLPRLFLTPFRVSFHSVPLCEE